MTGLTLSLRFGRAVRLSAAAASLALLAGCSVKNFAIKEIASSLAEGSGSAFAQEGDIDFAGEAIPFSLKLVESLLAAQPDNPDLLLAAASGFTQYAKGWVEEPADFIEDEDFFEAQRQYERAVKFYLRAYEYGLQGLEATHPGFSAEFRADPAAAVSLLTAADVDLAYWTAAALGSAISLSRTNPELLAQLPAVEALADRGLALNPEWGLGAIHELLVTLKSSGTGDPVAMEQTVRGHYSEVVRISGGAAASAHVSLAEAISIQNQNRAEFEGLLQAAVAVDADAHPDNRLAILVAQRRAHWLLERVDDLFLE